MLLLRIIRWFIFLFKRNKDVIVVKRPNFWLNPRNMYQGSYVHVPGWRMVMLGNYPHSFPEPQENQILYRLKGNKHRGWIYIKSENEFR